MAYAEANPEKIADFRDKNKEEKKQKYKSWKGSLSKERRDELSRKQREWYLKNKDAVLARAKASYERNKEKIHTQSRNLRLKKVSDYLFFGAKARAKKKGVPFSIEVEDVEVPDFCPVLGIHLKVGEGMHSPNSPTIDRFIPELGYVRGNICVISHRANTLKSDATIDEIQNLLDWMKSRESEG